MNVEIVAGSRRRLGRAAFDLWAWRGTVLSLTSRTLRSRYRQTLLGVAWTLIQSISGAVVIGILLGAAVDFSDDSSYLELVVVGMLIWTFYSRVVGSAVTSLLDEHLFIASAWFPRDVIPISRLLVGLVDLAVGFLVVAGVLAIAGSEPSVAWLGLLPTLVVLVLFTLASSLGPAAANLVYRDVGHGLTTVLQIGFFASPILFPASVVTEGWRDVYTVLNPVAAVIEAFRAVMLEARFPDWQILGLAGVWSVVLLGGSYLVFLRVEPSAADRV